MTAPDAAWTLRAPAAPEAMTTTTAAAVELDPRHRVVALGCLPRSGGGPALMSGAVLRQPLPGVGADGAPIDWAPAVAWLQGDAAAALLRQVSAGYQAEMLWSGDWVARWTPEAVGAAQTLIHSVREILTRQ